MSHQECENFQGRCGKPVVAIADCGSRSFPKPLRLCAECTRRAQGWDEVISIEPLDADEWDGDDELCGVMDLEERLELALARADREVSR